MNYKIKFIQLMMGQSISILGSSLTSFSLSLWVYEKTGEPSHLALLTFSYFCPMIYFSIFAGHFVDRFKRKIILLSCDLGLILASFLLLLLISTNEISILPLVCIIFVSGLFSCFKSITFQTTVSMFIDEKNLLKYNGFVSILQNIPVLLGPILGGILLSVITIKNIVLIDIITFLLSFIITLFIIFPDLSYKASKNFNGIKLHLEQNIYLKIIHLKKFYYCFLLKIFLMD